MRGIYLLGSILDRIMEKSGGIGDIIKYMTEAVNWLRGFLPVDNGALWLKENVPMFANIDQPSLILAVGMLVLWVIVAGITNMIQKCTPLFVVVIGVIAVAGYMGTV